MVVKIRPVVELDAVQLQGSLASIKEVYNFLRITGIPEKDRGMGVDPVDDRILKVLTFDGLTNAVVGDWIIKPWIPHGEYEYFMVCEDEFFKKHYEIIKKEN